MDALARALRLDETERAHLFDLARAADGIPTSGRPRRRTPGKAASRLSLQWALDAITGGVAFVRDPRDRALQDLVGELSTQSETFRRLWADHNVRTHGAGTKRFDHPLVGELVLSYEELAVTAEAGLVLMVYTAEPGSPSAERLRLLASWTAPTAVPTPTTAADPAARRTADREGH